MRALVSSLVLIALVSGCGYKAPLYLPKDKPQAQPRATTPAPDAKPAAKDSP